MDAHAEFLDFIGPQELRDARISRLLPTWVGHVSEPEADLDAVTLRTSPNSSLPALTVMRGRKGIGRYLTEEKILLLKDEEERNAALRAINLAGFEVLAPLPNKASDEPIFLGEVNVKGAW